MKDVIFHQVEWHANKNFHVYVHPKNRIEVHTRNGAGETLDVKVFHQGDIAEYDSYNLRYTGQIVSITAKNVIIKPNYGSSTKRLDVRNFAWRNHDFDLDKVSRENYETSMYI